MAFRPATSRLLLCAAALPLALGACAGGGAEAPGGSIRAAFGFDGPTHDVAAVSYAVYAGEVDCAAPDGEPVAGALSPLEAEYLPLWLEGDPPGGDAHPFADALFVLQPGGYTVCAVPLDEAGEPSLHCAPTAGTAEVLPEVTTEIVLYAQCLGDPTGGLDVVVALNDPPHIAALTIAPSKFVTICEEAVITVQASDPNGDELTYAWTAALGEAAPIALPETGPVLVLPPPAVGMWTITVTVTDGHGASATLSVPLHVSPGDCGCVPDCEGKVCGDDGCGGACGPGCAPNEVCSADQTACECVPDCEGKVCGDDGCGGACGPGCAPNEACSADQTACECIPSCVDGVCGDDGCGGLCGGESLDVPWFRDPVDLIVAIDNSGSMTEEIAEVQANINEFLAAVWDASGFDYRVIILARHGALSAESVCIEAPLSGIPSGGCASPPAQPVENPPRFFHHSVEIGSHNSWCRILEQLSVTDEFGLHPGGYGALLRPQAFKVFMELTDDGVSCSFGGATYNDSNSVAGGTNAAASFDAALTGLASGQFGTPGNRRYRWYSIIGAEAADPSDGTVPKLPSEPVTTAECTPGAVDPGTGYQALSILTDGLRFPMCDTASIGGVLGVIAQDVLVNAEVPCSLAVPTPPPGFEVDLGTVTYTYSLDGSAPAPLVTVPGPGDCTPDGIYYDPAIPAFALCPDACTAFGAAAEATVDVTYSCTPAGP